MKPIRNTLTARIGILKLYREEADQLVALFQNSCTSIVISNENSSFDDLDDMKKNLGATVQMFYLRGENPKIRFSFNKSEVVTGSNRPTSTVFNELQTEEISDAADALFYKIKDFLITHQQPSVRKLWLSALVVSFISLFLALSRYGVVVEQGQDKIRASAIPWFILGLLLLVGLAKLAFGVKNYLSLETKRNSGSFFMRNREEFGKHAVTAAISAVVGAVIGYLVAYVKK
jgi:hypothetical protein